MAPKPDIGWEFGTQVGESRKKVKCNFCGKTYTGGITRLKEHIAHVTGNVEACRKAPREISLMVRSHLQDSKAARSAMQKKKEKVLDAIQQGTPAIDIDSSDGDYDNFDKYGANEEALNEMEMKEMRKAMKESRKMRDFEEDMRNRYSGHPGAGSSLGTNPILKREMPRSSSLREGSRLPAKGIDRFMFPTKSKSIKNWLAPEKIKHVGKAISKWFIYNAIPFNAADSGPYYQSMINTIAEAGVGIQGPSGRQIGGIYLQEEVEDVEGYLNALKSKWPKYGCTLMCDGWSTRNKHPIINFMIYCDRDMIFHSSVDCTNKKKTADFILSLMNKVIDEIGEENVVHVVTDSESAMKAAGERLMIERPHLFWSPCAAHCIDLMLEDVGKISKVKRCIEKAKEITSFIYNSDKIVNLMKTYTNDRELLRPGITRFATEFIALESLARHSQDLKRMCTSNEWNEYNNTSKRRKTAENVAAIIMDAKFWKRVRDICNAMEPLVKVLKVVDQDKKPTLSIIYEAMDRAKMAIRQGVKDWKLYWDVIDDRWYRQLHQHLHAAAYFLNPVLHYSGTCVYDDVVKRSLKAVIRRLEPNLEDQVDAINEIKKFTEKYGEFGSALAQTAVKKTLPAEWWSEYGDDAPKLRKIAVKVLSQTCSSSGCERNWSTWSIIHTKLRNRLAIEKLHKLVFVHYNMRLRVRNFMRGKEDDDYYCPISLDHIFDDDDILNEWTRENYESAVLLDDDLEWLDKGLQVTNASSQNLSRMQHVDDRPGSSKSNRVEIDDDNNDSDDSNDGNNQQGVGELRAKSNQDSQPNTGMTWAKGDENYYATQDTDHGYRPGIEEQRRFLASLTGFSSSEERDYSGGTSRPYTDVGEQLNSLALGVGVHQQISENPCYFGENARGYHAAGYGHSDCSRDDSFHKWHDYSTSDARESNQHGFGYESSHYSGHSHYAHQGYPSAQNRHPNLSRSISSGVGRREHDTRYSSTAESSIGSQGFGYYNRRDEALLNLHSSSQVESVSSTQSNQNPDEQFQSSVYPDYYVPPRHSSWY